MLKKDTHPIFNDYHWISGGRDGGRERKKQREKERKRDKEGEREKMRERERVRERERDSSFKAYFFMLK